MIHRICIPLVMISFLLLAGCGGKSASQSTFQTTGKTYQTGVLPQQTSALLEEEWRIYRARHPEMGEQEARHSFDIIQIMSSEHYDARTAVWADRKFLANRWIEKEIEDVYSPETLSDEIIQAAIDAYAFKSGTPALVTASHILVKPNKTTTAEERRNALESVRKAMLEKKEFSNEAMSKYAQMLVRAGFRTYMNADLTFPKSPMQSFMGEQLDHPAVVQPFADAAFALSKNNRLSPVVESEFGFHLILFMSKTEEVKADIKKNRDFMVSKIVQQGRKLASEQKITDLMKAGHIRVNEARVAEIAGGNQSYSK